MQFVRKELGHQVCAVAGHSKGGNTVLLYGSKYDDLPLIVNMAGRYDMRQGVTQRFGAALLQQLDREGQVEQSTINGYGELVSYTLTKQVRV